MLLTRSQMTFFPESESHIIDKVKVLSELSNYATKKWKEITGSNTSDLAAKNIVLKNDIEKLYINKLLNALILR